MWASECLLIVQAQLFVGLIMKEIMGRELSVFHILNDYFTTATLYKRCPVNDSE